VLLDIHDVLSYFIKKIYNFGDFLFERMKHIGLHETCIYFWFDGDN